MTNKVRETTTLPIEYRDLSLFLDCQFVLRHQIKCGALEMQHRCGRHDSMYIVRHLTDIDLDSYHCYCGFSLTRQELVCLSSSKLRDLFALSYEPNDKTWPNKLGVESVGKVAYGHIRPATEEEMLKSLREEAEYARNELRKGTQDD